MPLPPPRVIYTFVPARTSRLDSDERVQMPFPGHNDVVIGTDALDGSRQRIGIARFVIARKREARLVAGDGLGSAFQRLQLGAFNVHLDQVTAIPAGALEGVVDGHALDRFGPRGGSGRWRSRRSRAYGTVQMVHRETLIFED